MKTRVMFYGVDDYAGGVISRRAAERGIAHIAAGQNIARVASVANALSKKSPGLVEPRIFGLGDKSRLAGQLDDVAVLVNCYPRFSDAAEALIEACLATNTNYLDLLQERLTFEQVFERDSEAVEAGISLVPGLDFNLTGPEIVASRLATMLPSGTELTIAVAPSSLSQGEARALVEACRGPGECLENGELIAAEPGERRLDIDFGKGDVEVYLAPWRYESMLVTRTGPFSTVNSFEALPSLLVRTVMKRGWHRWLFRRGKRLAVLARRIAVRGEGPSHRKLRKSRCVIWGEARNADGQIVRARLETPASQIYTAEAVLLAAQSLLDGKITPGVHLPSAVCGAALIDNIEGTIWRELPDGSEVETPDLDLTAAAS